MNRIGRSNRYELAFNDGIPYIDRLEEETVMFSNMRELGMNDI